MKFSLIIPCYNEGRNLPLLVESCKVLATRPGIEVIFVDNGSTDGTPEIFLQLLPKYPSCRTVHVEKNQGYGHGILTGLRAAQGEILGWTHADMQTDPLDLLQGLALFEQYGDNIFVKGKRYGRPFIDAVFTVGMSLFETVLLAKPMWDINAQPTMFSRKFFETWDSPPNDFSLDLYAYYQAHHQKLKVQRFPVKFSKRAYGVSHWNINWKAKWKFIRRTVDFSLQLRSRTRKKQ
ncbi:glycosyltransferase family 2 protein [Candidatus Regiella endosymbiont of Tuberolachnus salignus]|uniref:glycosyltransferase family 2 protein n=1 Tax=Candidatus Regiella endosymbiont of Tuberolachnus salignus TaxID=3077956 RepID=UPI0030CD6C78